LVDRVDGADIRVRRNRTGDEGKHPLGAGLCRLCVREYRTINGGQMTEQNDLVYRLKKRAEIRRQIPGRKSVESGEPDRIADLLDEAAKKIELLDRDYRFMRDLVIGEEARSKELEKELKRTKFAWNMAENEIESLQKERKAQEK